MLYVRPPSRPVLDITEPFKYRYRYIYVFFIIPVCAICLLEFSAVNSVEIIIHLIINNYKANKNG